MMMNFNPPNSVIFLSRHSPWSVYVVMFPDWTIRALSSRTLSTVSWSRYAIKSQRTLPCGVRIRRAPCPMPNCSVHWGRISMIRFLLRGVPEARQSRVAVWFGWEVSVAEAEWVSM